MSLIKGFSSPSFSKNVATEIRAGRKPAQASAIAFSLRNKARKGMWDGGMAYDEGGEVEGHDDDELMGPEMSIGYLMGKDTPVQKEEMQKLPEYMTGKKEERQSFLDKLFQKKMASGGLVKPVEEEMEMMPEDQGDMDDYMMMDEEPTAKELYQDEDEKPSREKLLTALFMRRAMKR